MTGATKNRHAAQMRGPKMPVKDMASEAKFAGRKLIFKGHATNKIAKPRQPLMSDRAKTPGKANR